MKYPLAQFSKALELLERQTAKRIPQNGNGKGRGIFQVMKNQTVQHLLTFRPSCFISIGRNITPLSTP